MTARQPGAASVSADPTERTSLLRPNGNGTSDPNSTATTVVESPSANGTVDDDEELDPDRPLPKMQILLLSFVRAVEPIGYFSIFAYAPAMVREVGQVPESDIGFWTGAIESLMSIAQMLTMIPWGRASDRYGRKPILVISLIGIAVSLGLFGFSRNLWQMILFRVLGGFFAGTLTTIRAMYTELSTPKTQARAFSFFSVAGNVGISLGPFVGGLLADPVKQYPGTFGNSQFLKDYPFVLPSILTFIICMAAVLVTIFFIDETHKPKKTADGKFVGPEMSTLELTRQPGVAFVLFMFTYVLLLGFGYTAILPTFWYTSPKLGGFGFSSAQISVFLGLGGGAQALWMLFVFSPLQRRVGTGGVLRLCAVVWPLSPVVYPLWHWVRKSEMTGLFWAGVPIFTVVFSGVAMSFTACQLALNGISPSHNMIGTLNAVAMTLAALCRAVSPAAFASLYAVGVRRRILDGQLAWLVFFVLTVLYGLTLRWLPEKAEQRPEKEVERRDEEERA